MTYEFSLSNDVELIKSVTLLPNNIDYNYDDNFEDPKSFNPPIIDSIYYIKVEKDGVFLGFFFLIKRCDAIAVRIWCTGGRNTITDTYTSSGALYDALFI